MDFVVVYKTHTSGYFPGDECNIDLNRNHHDLTHWGLDYEEPTASENGFNKTVPLPAKILAIDRYKNN